MKIILPRVRRTRECIQPSGDGLGSHPNREVQLLLFFNKILTIYYEVIVIL